MNHAYYILLIAFLSTSCQERTLFTLVSSIDSNIDFRNEIVETPDNNIMTYQYMYNGAGVALGDIDNDGLTDVYLVGNSQPNKFYLNKGDWKFEDVTEKYDLGGRPGHWKTGVSMVDINGDGWLDIYLCYSGNVQGESMNAPIKTDRTERSNQLFINQGNKGNGVYFKEQAATYGLEAIGTFSSQSYFLDYDLDGDLDMFLVNHANMFYAPYFNTSSLRNKRHPYFGNQLFRNDGHKFIEVSESAGIHGSGLNYGLSAAIADLNNDKWPDIYVTNDYDEQDFLYINNQDGTFREVSHTSFGHISKFSMGSDLADINNDGHEDLFVADMLPKDNKRQKLLKGPDAYDKYHLSVDSGFHHQNMRNMLHVYVNSDHEGNPRYKEVGQMSGISNTDWSWATLFADYDNDGLLDLFVTNGYLHDYTNMDFLKYAQDRMGKVITADVKNQQEIKQLINTMPSTPLANYCFKGMPSLQFQDAGKVWGINEKSISNGAAYGDLDNDGDLDLVINNLNQQVHIYRNNTDTKTNHFLKVRLDGEGENTMGIGAQLKIDLDTTVLSRQAYYNRGYQSSVEPTIFIGLGKVDRVNGIKVEWPSGAISTVDNVLVNSTITISEKDAVKDSVSNTEESDYFFEKVTDEVGLQYAHQENKFADFKIQRLIPYEASKLGYRIAKGDVNNDGNDDFFLGGAIGTSGVLYLSDHDGHYSKAASQPWEADKTYEDIDQLFFDADGDGDLDLYVVSGGNEYPPNHSAYEDRLYVNQGNGAFVRDLDALPSDNFISGGSVVPSDYDNDGDIDLFVGGRIEPQFYPLSPRSKVLKNVSTGGAVKFVEVTANLSNELVRMGMVTDAVWSDLNNDGWDDLIVVGEWMPLKVFLNESGSSFVEVSEEMGLQNTHGWWTRIVGDDLDGDGDMDFIVGNAGTNLQYNASEEEPVEFFVQDLNNDQDPDPIMSYYIQGKRYPVASYDELIDQMRGVRKRFKDYEAYSVATVDDVLQSFEKSKSFHYKINTLESSVLLNQGNSFSIQALPKAAQESMVNGIVIEDFDHDGSNEILLVGNFFPYRVEWGKSDSFFGAFFKMENGRLVSHLSNEKLYFDGDIRDVQLLKMKNGERRVIISRNNNDADIYSF
ncbi:MAG: VCBS repeat-containing protein [Marinoscillum sp.]